MFMSPAPYARQAGRQFFYCNGKIVAELNGDARWRFFQANGLALAQKDHQSSGLSSMLAASDQQRSVLFIYEKKRLESQAYSPYGHHNQGSGLLSLLAFSGERLDASSGLYHLGNGYRQFSPVMMRFCSPDSWSPFGAGSFNAYAYCVGDPVNRIDPTGHAGVRVTIQRKQSRPNRPVQKVMESNSLVSKERIYKRNGADRIIPESRAGVGEDVSFESLFNSHEIAEQHRLFAQFNAPARTSSESKKVFFQSHDSGPDVEAGKRYAQSLNVHKDSLESEIKARDLKDLLSDLDAVNARMSAAGSSRDLMIQAALIAEIRMRPA
jgi:RHS repeat-associated protein